MKSQPLDDNYIWDTFDTSDDLDDFNPEDLIEEDDILKLIDDESEKQTKKLLEQEKTFHRNNLQKSQKRIYLFAGLIVILLVALIFMPLIKVNTIHYNPTYFISKDIVVENNIVQEQEKISIWDMFYMEARLRKKTGLSLDAHFNWKTGELSININEKIPLAKNNNITYYRNGSKIETSEDFPYLAPLLINFTDDLVNPVVEQLSQLDYNIIKEINSISLQPSEQEPNLLVLTMNDGNYVFIHIDQIAKKMPYYLQLTDIVKNVHGDGKTGIFHLNYGDYYEPI